MYTYPQYEKLRADLLTYQKINEANAKAAALRVIRGRLTDDKNKISGEDMEKLERMLPDSVENVSLILEINNIAKQYGMSIKGTSIAESSARSSASVGPDSQMYGAITLAFSVTTNYDNFQTFLKALEDNNRLVDVTGLTFSAAKDDNYDFSVTIKTYWLK